LADCSDKNKERTELFIVEGDSAGGSAKQGRHRETQAILPLFGKILNTERAHLDKIVKFEEIKDLIIALGAGIGESLNYDKVRYHRVIIMTDADVDGAHIRTLLLTFFYRFMPSIITRGYLYIAQPPLYQVRLGKDMRWAYSDEEKDKVMAEMMAKISKGKETKVEAEPVTETEVSEEADAEKKAPQEGTGRTPNIQRYKGLGEMNAEQLWDTTMDPAHRILLQVTIEDAQGTDEVFSTLMGDEVAPRKRFIQTHAKQVQNLDI